MLLMTRAAPLVVRAFSSPYDMRTSGCKLDFFVGCVPELDTLFPGFDVGFRCFWVQKSYFLTHCPFSNPVDACGFCVFREVCTQVHVPVSQTQGSIFAQ
jgi:hypothetical protein